MKDQKEICLLILYPVTLYKPLIRSSIFLVASLGFSMYSIVSSVNSDSFTTLFPMWIPFVSSLIAVARTSKTMLNSSGESGYPCLVPDFRGNALKFSPLRIMFAVDLSCLAFLC